MSPAWHNHTGNQSCNPREVVRPGSLEELVELVRHAEGEATTVRAVGAAHSWSDAALTDGYLVEPDNLSGVEQVDPATLRAGARGLDLVRVLGGTHLYTLNAELDRMGLALRNMGGYDAQTISGVVSTSTHGSGTEFGPSPTPSARSTSSSPGAGRFASSRRTARPIRRPSPGAGWRSSRTTTRSSRPSAGWGPWD